MESESGREEHRVTALDLLAAVAAEDAAPSVAILAAVGVDAAEFRGALPVLPAAERPTGLNVPYADAAVAALGRAGMGRKPGGPLHWR